MRSITQRSENMKAILEIRIKKVDENYYRIDGFSKQNMGFAVSCPKDQVDANIEDYARQCRQKYSTLTVRIIQDDRQTKINGVKE